MAKKKQQAAERRPIAVCLSDCHVQERAWASRPTLKGDACHAFSFICNYAIERALPLLGAGDLIDKQSNEAFLANYLRRELDKLARAHVPFFYVQGQHELQYPVPWLSALHAWPTHLNDDMDTVGDLQVWGMDWTHADNVQTMLDTAPNDADILLAHQVTDEFMGRICKAELSWSQVPGNFKLLLIGDYHDTHARLLRENKEGRPLVVLCPGAMAMQKIDEPVLKQFFVLYDDLTTDSIPIPSRHVLKPPRLNTEDELVAFVTSVRSQCQAAAAAAADEGLPEALHKPLLYVEYASELEHAYRRIMTAASEVAFVFPKELRTVSSERVAEQQIHQEVIERGLLGALPTLVSDTESPLFKTAYRLLSGAQPKAVLFELRKEYLDDTIA